MGLVAIAEVSIMITIATAPKPFTNPHIATIQWNAIQSWVHLGSEVDVILVGDEPGIEDIAAEIGIPHLKNVDRNASGTPLVSSVFQQMRQYNKNPFLLYANADILLLPDLLIAIQQLVSQSVDFLGVGQRWDLDICEKLDFEVGWKKRLIQDVKARGRLHAPVGSDYFVFPRSLFARVPDFAVGRAGWDNWMIYSARKNGWKVVDLTKSVYVIHQDHDYSHLPGGQPHYRLPETAENTRMAGGRRVIFTLHDANFHLRDGKLELIPLSGLKWLREVEIFPLVRLNSRWLGEITFAIFHPVQAWHEWKARLVYLFQKIKRKLN
jgi:hypothetical protein